ncbi:TetR/AcrR family transcriptional regulator [Bacillus rubiinfantis]|uniref:TetR/AcrR family transcriptional regulator n=1 Tax=Bacillus rubiinfantis TaxID=1499680 RepID=UPI0005A82AC0|nr:TetR/AcrR family transcriptional regulator [Bacillus rubiinfantis]
MEKKKNDIIRSAISIIAEKGYEKTTMEEIAAQLLMTKGSMYYYFKNKEELLFACHMMIIEPSIEVIKEFKHRDLEPDEKIKGLIKDYIMFEISEKSMFNVAGKLDQTFSAKYLEKILKKRDEFNHIFDELIWEGIEAGVFKNVNVKMARMMILAGMNSVQSWYKQDGTMKPEEIAEIHADYLVKILL